jgi:hypothetical protein
VETTNKIYHDEVKALCEKAIKDFNEKEPDAANADNFALPPGDEDDDKKKDPFEDDKKELDPEEKKKELLNLVIYIHFNHLFPISSYSIEILSLNMLILPAISKSKKLVIWYIISSFRYIYLFIGRENN